VEGACRDRPAGDGKSVRVFVRVGVADRKVSCPGKSDSPQPTARRVLLPDVLTVDVNFCHFYRGICRINVSKMKILSLIHWIVC